MMRARAYRGSGHPGAPIDRNPGAAERIPPARRPETARERRAGRLWGIAWELTRWAPERVAFALADLAGRIAFRCARGARARITANLRHVVTTQALDDAVRDAFRSYARYWVEAFRVADMDPGELDRRTTTDGVEHLDEVLERGDGAIVLLAHHGSWDVAARWAESHRYHLAVVAEVVRPRVLFEKFVRLREGIGLEVVPLRRGQDLVSRLTDVLQANHLVGLLTDRDLSGKAPVVELFGAPTRVPLGAAVLSRRTGTPIVPITMLQRPGRCWHLQVLPPIETRGLSISQGHRAVVAGIESLIRIAPEQWHAFQPVFLDEETAPEEDPAVGLARTVGPADAMEGDPLPPSSPDSAGPLPPPESDPPVRGTPDPQDRGTPNPPDGGTPDPPDRGTP